jgi:3-oxoacyl-[acyl-carrier protein] reductase
LGKRVVLLDRDIRKADTLIAREPRVQAVEVDLSDAAAAQRCFDALDTAGVQADILVNSVGISPKFDARGERLRFWTTPPEEWIRLFDVNVMSYVACQRAVIPGMIERRYGRIVNVGSYAARTGGYQGASHYQTAKSAILGMTRALAREVGRYGITVNTVNPGRIRTPMTQDVSPAVNAAFVDSIPLGRLGEPEDVAGAAVFLASSLADYITGAALEVNGGVFMNP